MKLCLFAIGAASGIGLSVAKKLLSAGCHVYACDMNEPGLKKELGGYENAVCLKLDITSNEDVNRVAAEVRKHTDRLYAVVNSAGIAGPPHYRHALIQGAIELDVDKDVMPVININLMGMWRVNHALFPLLYESHGSTIVNIASLAGLFGAPGMGPYVCSKFGVVGYSEVLRRELAPYRIRVVTVEPGFVRTNLTEGVFKGEEKDFSQTKLFAGRGADEKAMMLTLEGMPGPSLVSDAIYKALFIDSNKNIPHLLLDVPLKLAFWKITLFMPTVFADWVVELAGGNRRKVVDAAWK